MNNQQQTPAQQPNNQATQPVLANQQGLPQLTADELAVANQVFSGVLSGTSVQKDAFGNTILSTKKPISQQLQPPQYLPVSQQYTPVQELPKPTQTNPVQQTQASSLNYGPPVSQQQSNPNNLQLSASTGTSSQQTPLNLQEYQQPGITITPRKQEDKKTNDQAMSEMVGYMQFLETKVAALEQQLSSQKASQQGSPSEPMQQTPQKQQVESFTAVQTNQDSQNIESSQNIQHIKKSIGSAGQNNALLIPPMTSNQTKPSNNMTAINQTQQQSQNWGNPVNSNKDHSQTSTIQNGISPKTALKQNSQTVQNSPVVQRPGSIGGKKVSFSGQSGSQATHAKIPQNESLSNIVQNRPYVYNESGQKVYIGESVAFGHSPAQKVTFGRSPAQQATFGNSHFQSRPISTRGLPSMPTQTYIGSGNSQVRSRVQGGASINSNRTPATGVYYGQTTPIKHISAPIRTETSTRALAKSIYPEIRVEQSVIHHAPSNFSKRPPPVTAHGIHKVGTSSYQQTNLPQGRLSDGLTAWSHAKYPTTSTSIYL